MMSSSVVSTYLQTVQFVAAMQLVICPEDGVGIESVPCCTTAEQHRELMNQFVDRCWPRVKTGKEFRAGVHMFATGAIQELLIDNGKLLGL